jgi:hypothetical protein
LGRIRYRKHKLQEGDGMKIVSTLRRLLGAAIVLAFLAVPAIAIAQDAPPAPAATAPAADAAAPVADAAAAVTPKLDSGDTAWMLTSVALVLMMTIPGLALFYGGMVRKKNVLATLMQSFAITCLVTVLWTIIGYSLAFRPGTGAMSPYLGGFDRLFLNGLEIDSISDLAKTIPESVYMCFQMTFAIITHYRLRSRRALGVGTGRLSGRHGRPRLCRRHRRSYQCRRLRPRHGPGAGKTHRLPERTDAAP